MTRAASSAAAVAVAWVMATTAVPAERAAAEEKGPHAMIFDFRSGSEPWRSINDVVMGGASSSEMVVFDGVAAFRGELSLAGGGGFASVRSDPRDLDLSDFTGLVLRVRGDGKRYKLRLRTTASFDGVSYQAPLQPSAGVWQEVAIPFAAFEPVFRGRPVPDHPPLDRSQVKTVGLLISDRQAGPFRIEIEWIRGDLETP